MRFYTFISTIVGVSANSLFNPNCPRRNDTTPKPPPEPTTTEAPTQEEPQQDEPEYPVDETSRSDKSQQPAMQPDNKANTPPPSEDSTNGRSTLKANGNVASGRPRWIRGRGRT